MKNKNRSDLLIFCGFIFLAISFFALVFYFQYQNNLLNEKSIELSKREEKIKIQEIENSNSVNENEELKKMIPISFQNRVDSISKETIALNKKEISSIVTDNRFENSVIYIQVSSKETKLRLQNLNFISKLNEKGYNIINAFDIEENGVDNSIRYFNEEDRSLAEKLKKDINDKFQNIILTTRFTKGFKVPVGQIEIWVK